MTPLEINKAIAEACGHSYHKPSPQEIASGSYYQYEPNYHGDLNAMHEAEETLSHDEQLEYAELLTSNLSEEFCDLEGTREHVFACARFTAAQRAEAFLRVKGLWRETI
jgi:hypothetical protein